MELECVTEPKLGLNFEFTYYKIDMPTVARFAFHNIQGRLVRSMSIEVEDISDSSSE
jgi:hypothetical protein